MKKLLVILMVLVINASWIHVKAEEPANVISMSMVETKPSFPGGDGEMYKWIGNSLSYPAIAAEEGIQGRVIVEFIVEKDGSITNVKVLRSRHPALDKEAVRVVNAMPKWQPGMNNGQPVRVSYVLPITFKLSIPVEETSK